LAGRSLTFTARFPLALLTFVFMTSLLCVMERLLALPLSFREPPLTPFRGVRPLEPHHGRPGSLSWASAPPCLPCRACEGKVWTRVMRQANLLILHVLARDRAVRIVSFWDHRGLISRPWSQIGAPRGQGQGGGDFGRELPVQRGAGKAQGPGGPVDGARVTAIGNRK
jgi:hypothetical protein